LADGFWVLVKMDRLANTELSHLLTRSSDSAADALLKRVEQKDDFHSKRMRCVTNPDRALETLGPYARLEVVIQCAKDLLPRESWIGQMTLDPCVEVFLDDLELETEEKSAKQTWVVRGTTRPVWKHPLYVDVLSPSSMVRFQVYDDQVVQKVEMGFVEICVGDIPYDTKISGWFEVRFQDNLKKTSVQRYASHCAMREDEVGMAAADIGQKTSSDPRDAKSASSVSSSAVPVDLRARRQVTERALLKTKTYIHSFSHACAGSASSGVSRELDRGNAGELFLQLRLVKVVSGIDSTFALALDMPAPKSYGDYVLEEEGQKVRKSLDLQEVVDTFSVVKIRLWEDCICCIYYYVRYIATWQQPLISLPIFLGACATCIHAYWATIVVPGTVGCLLSLNGWGTLRGKMTRGGLNAPFTQDGFRQAARWRKTGEMAQYMKRIVEDDLSGSVQDMPQLRRYARVVFRDGVPVCTFEDLKAILRRLGEKEEIVKLDTHADLNFNKGDLVIVDHHKNATVVGFGSDGKILITYDFDKHTPDDPKAEAASDGVKKSTQTTPTSPSRELPVDPVRLRHRQTIKRYQAWLLPTSIRNSMADAMEQIEKIERSALYPALHFLTQVVTWNGRKCISGLIVVTSLLLFALAIRTETVYEHDSDDDTRSLEEWGAVTVITLMRNVDNIILFILVFLVFVFNAKWFNVFASSLKVLSRLGQKRKAPDLWKFYREDEQMEKAMEALNLNGGDWPDFGKLAKLPDSLRGAMASVPDLQKVQAKIRSIKGLENFKLVDPTHPSNQTSSATAPAK